MDTITTTTLSYNNQNVPAALAVYTFDLLSGGAVVQSQDFATKPSAVVFTTVPAGTYQVKGYGKDGNGNTLGTPALSNTVVLEPTITADLPDTIVIAAS